MSDSSNCLMVSKTDDGISREFSTLSLGQLAADHVRVRVEYSSLNYKDALCSSGHPGVAKTLPIVPGIDAAGVIEADPTGRFKTGESVMVFHAELGLSLIHI